MGNGSLGRWVGPIRSGSKGSSLGELRRTIGMEFDPNKTVLYGTPESIQDMLRRIAAELDVRVKANERVIWTPEEVQAVLKDKK